MRVLVADDQQLFRDSLVALLTAHGIEVVAAVSDREAALAAARRERPDIALIDLRMPQPVDGLDLTRTLSRELPGTSVVILSGSEQDDDLLAALQAGARGYLVKNLDGPHFLTLLAAAGRGESVLSPHLARRVLSELRHRPQRTDPDALTGRETEILRLMTSGLTSNRRLARHLTLSENTVKFHVRNILDKLHLNSRAQAVGHALRHRLVDAAAPRSSRAARRHSAPRRGPPQWTARTPESGWRSRARRPRAAAQRRPRGDVPGQRSRGVAGQ